jgi:hypothetical protein
MEALLQQVADGSLHGIKKYYTLFHASHCYQCGSFLNRIKTMMSVIRDKKENVAPDAAMERLKTRIKELDSEAK